MSCDITKGRLLDCKDAVGGLKAVYFINYSSYTNITAKTRLTYRDFTYETTDGYGTMIKDFGTPTDKPSAFKYDLHLGNDLTQNIQSSAENGTLYFEQVLSLTLKKLTNADNQNIQEMASGHPYVIIEDQMGNFWYAGLVNGMDVTGGTAVTGQAFGDLNGYTLTLTGMERNLANFIEGGLATVEGGFTIVEGTTA